MLKKSIIGFAVVFVCVLALDITFAQSAEKLKISDNHRFIVREDGTPFFYLGDTAWELFHRLDREEADIYLINRADKGFTVIQAVVLAERDGLDDPNPYGDLPLEDKNPEKPIEAYFSHVDYIVNKAEELGLTIGMLPTWGSYWSGNNPVFTPENGYSFGKFLGNRYKNKPIIWILGGDQNVRNDNDRAIIEAMAAGLGDGDGGEHLITFHPRGPGLSSDFFHNAEWLDFNMYQSSHAAHDHDNGLFADNDYNLNPPKPTLDGEPRYETIPVGFYFDGFNRHDRFDDYDCRQAAYWSLLAGACGHTYGNNSVWQMYSEKHVGVINVIIPWNKALDHPGAFQMGIVRKLFESRPYQLLVPSTEIIKDGPSTGGGKIRAAVASDRSFAFIYSPRGEKFTIDKSMIRAEKYNEIWFDTRYGVSYVIHSPDTAGIQTYTPPTSGRGCDWIFILEDKNKNYTLPAF
ncbi:glycoside hydrolase family 140 protein [Candidatus Latescibacterota bacterium]